MLWVEPADKPGSVVDNHSSGTCVTTGLMRPTRRHRGPRFCLPIWSCFEWGLPCHKVLPPVRCALTAPFHPYLPTPLTVGTGGILSAALSVGSRPPGVTWHPALRSPDFPHRTPQGHTARLPGRLRGYFPLLGYELTARSRIQSKLLLFPSKKLLKNSGNFASLNAVSFPAPHRDRDGKRR